MVYIKKVETRGFKSFGSRPVSVNFEGRFIGITGPNGSGKSNIIDAILFAIGENRPRMMRVPKLSGLIFDGAGSTPSTSARVTITLDNTSREIAIDNDRVTLTREIRSGGDSVYLLNGKKIQKHFKTGNFEKYDFDRILLFFFERNFVRETNATPKKNPRIFCSENPCKML